MAKQKRYGTKYPGVFFIVGARASGEGQENIYYIRYRRDGRAIEEKAGRQYTDAMTPARANQVRVKRIEGAELSNQERRAEREAQKQAAKAKKWTITRLFDAYIKAMREGVKGKSAHALVNDRNRFENHIKPVLGDMEPKDIQLIDIDTLNASLKNRRTGKKLKPQTVVSILGLLSWTINYGVSRGLCQPLSFKIERPAVDNQKTEDLTPEQLQSLLKSISSDPNQMVANLMKMALFTGMRRGELLKLEWDDINYERGFITLRRPKGKRTQEIPLNKPTRKLLKNHPRLSGCPLVFHTTKGDKLGNIQRAVNRIKKAAKLPEGFRPLHGLRHVYASELASSGAVDIYTLQKLLTHKDQRMTQRYAHLRDKALREAAELAGDIFEHAEQEAKNTNLKVVK